MLKPPMHIRYSRLCYYCICQVCNLRRCPFSRHHSRFDVCSRCLSRSERHARLDCDFFEHFRKTDYFHIKYKHIPKNLVNNKIYVVLTHGRVFGPYHLSEAHEVLDLLGTGVIRILDIYKHDLDDIK